MRVLITNDDGFYADGIRYLVEEMAKIAELVVIAPDRERSATSHAITMHYPLRIYPSKHFGDNVQGFYVDGTPTDCVKLGVQAVLETKPDLVLSGINRGANLGTDILYSGTVSAAIEAIMLGIPSLAFSICAFTDCQFATAAQLARYLVETVANKEIPPDTLLNVNYPNLKLEDLRGFRVTRLGIRRYTNVFEKRLDPRGRPYYWMAGEAMEDGEQDTDIGAVQAGYVSVTPVHFDLTRFSILEEIKSWNLTLPVH